MANSKDLQLSWGTTISLTLPVKKITEMESPDKSKEPRSKFQVSNLNGSYIKQQSKITILHQFPKKGHSPTIANSLYPNNIKP